MAKTIDITSKLTNERPKLRLAEGREYEIDNRKNTVLAIQSKMDQKHEGIAYLDEVLELALGKAAVDEINASDISFNDYQTIFMAVLAGAMGEDLEAVESRFHAAKQTS